MSQKLPVKTASAASMKPSKEQVNLQSKKCSRQMNLATPPVIRRLERFYKSAPWANYETITLTLSYSKEMDKPSFLVTITSPEPILEDVQVGNILLDMVTIIKISLATVKQHLS